MQPILFQAWVSKLIKDSSINSRTIANWAVVSLLCWIISPSSPVFCQELGRDRPKSREAAKLLSEAADEFQELDQKKGFYSVREGLVKLLVANLQFDEAHRFLQTQERQFGLSSLITEAQVKFLTREIDEGIGKQEIAERVEAIKRVAASGEIFDSQLHFRKLIELEQVEFAKEIAEAFPGDLRKYQYKSGVFSNQWNKMRMMSAIAAEQMAKGSDAEAKEIFDQFEIEATRDQAKLNSLMNCLQRKPGDAVAAQKLYELMELEGTKSWACFWFGYHFFQQQQTVESLHWAEEMDVLLGDADDTSKFYFPKLLLCVAQLQLSEGTSADWAINRFSEVPHFKGDDKALDCIRVLAGEGGEIAKDPERAMWVVKLLIDFDESGYDRPYSPLQHTSSESGLKAAIGLAGKVKHPHARANALNQIAEKVFPFSTPVFEEPLTVQSLDLSKELTVQSFESAKLESDPVQPSEGGLVDQGKVLGDVAKLFAMQGELKLSMEAIELVFGLVGDPEPRKIEVMLSQVAKVISSLDEPYLQNGGADVFEFCERLCECDYRKTSNSFRQIVGKFAVLGYWDRAEVALKKGERIYGKDVVVPIAIANEIAKSNDVERLLHWNDLSSQENRHWLLHYVCDYFNKSKTFPDATFLIELDSLVDACEENGREIGFEIRKLLFIGYSVDGLSEEAGDQLEKIRAKYGDRMMRNLVSAAMATGLPDLAVKLSKETGEKSSMATTFRFSGRVADYQPDQLKDKEWIDSQPLDARIAFKMRRARALIKAVDEQ